MMFAASARHTNAGIAARQGLPITALSDHSYQIRAQQRLAAEQRYREWLDSQPKLRSTAQVILAEISALHGFDAAAIKSKSRTNPIVIARHHAIYEIRRRCRDVSTTVIGRLVGGRDHTTVMFAIRHWPKKAAVLGIPCEPMPEVR